MTVRSHDFLFKLVYLEIYCVFIVVYFSNRMIDVQLSWNRQNIHENHRTFSQS